MVPFFTSSYKGGSDPSSLLPIMDIYRQIIENPEEFDINISDFSVAIRYDHIISVSPFDPKTYTKFRELANK